jgi:ribose-phosphate pyrophosphokinase
MSVRLVSPNCRDLYPPNLEIGSFPDGDSHVRVPNIADCADQDVTLYHRLYPRQNEALVELLLMLDALKQVGARAIVVAPYLPYARQDKKFLEGEVSSAEVVCNLLFTMGCTKLVTFDCHFLKAEGQFTYGHLFIDNISLSGRLIAHAKEVFGGDDFEIVAPDQGALYLVKNFGGKAMRKVREAYKNEMIRYREVKSMELDFNVAGKNVLVIDDIISTGSTILKAVNKLKEAGAVKVCIAAVHGFFLNDSLEKLKAICEDVFVSDTIASPAAAVRIKEALTVVNL